MDAWKLAFALVLLGTTSVLAHCWRMSDDQLVRLWSLDFELIDQRPGLLCGDKKWILSEDKRGWGGGPSLTPLPSLPALCTGAQSWIFSFSFVYLFGCAGSLWWHVESFFSCSMWDLVPWPGMEPVPRALGAQSLLSPWISREVPWSFYSGSLRGFSPSASFSFFCFLDQLPNDLCSSTSMEPLSLRFQQSSVNM